MVDTLGYDGSKQNETIPKIIIHDGINATHRYTLRYQTVAKLIIENRIILSHIVMSSLLINMQLYVLCILIFILSAVQMVITYSKTVSI